MVIVQFTDGKVTREMNFYAAWGRVAEWSKAPVLKTGVLTGTVGSTPTPSATLRPLGYSLKGQKGQKGHKGDKAYVVFVFCVASLLETA